MAKGMPKLVRVCQLIKFENAQIIFCGTLLYTGNLSIIEIFMIKTSALIFVTLLLIINSLPHYQDQQQLQLDNQRDHHTPLTLEQVPIKKKTLTQIELDNSRLLQDNPFSPTGEIMTTTPGTRPNDDLLTIDLINQVSQQSGISTRPTTPATTSNPLFTIGNNVAPLNVSVSSMNSNNLNSSFILSNQTWNLVDIEDYTNNPFWIAANNFLQRINISYFMPNQILILYTQKASIGTVFNLTFRSVRGFTNAIVLVSQSYNPTLVSSQIITMNSIPVDSLSALYNVTRSLLQSLFYDFTMSPLVLLNGTQTRFSQGFTLYDLRYQSKNGIYSYQIKSQVTPNGSVVGAILSCNPITISVATQTVPVLASINIVNVDANFKFVNKTISNFFGTNLNYSNFRMLYNSVAIWANRAGTAILYYVNVTLVQSNSNQSYLIGVNHNITHRSQIMTYFRNTNPQISSNSTSTGYHEVPYLQILSNSTFASVDLSARSNYPTVVVGPIVKIQIQRTKNQTGFRLTYFGVGGQNVQAAYNPST